MAGRRPAALAALALLAGCGDRGPAAEPVLTASAADVRALPTVAATELPRERRITIAASGDFLIHQPLWSRALADGGGRYDFRPQLRAIAPVIRRADVALCHVETPLVPGAPSGYPLFRTPPALARAIRWAGWDVCSTASNHTVDAGQRGVDSTRRALGRAGLRHTGGFSTAAQQRRVTMLRVRGIRVAFLSYTAVSNGIPSPHPWSLNVAEPRRILGEARRARRQGASVVIVNLHWGDEYAHAPSAAQLALARRLAASKRITAVVGQHAHVVQPIAEVRGMTVVFGEGNLTSNQDAGCCPAASQDGIVAMLRIAVRGDRARVVRVRAIPTFVRRPDYVVLPVRRALRYGFGDAGQLRASLRRTRFALGIRVPSR
jgi:poly-gamma-glutamate capsule biosynthesis protein CapA/YwtB (metallophosphatase superfamily)